MPHHPPLPPCTAHIWYLRLDQPPAVAGQLEHFLSPDEWARVRRFRSGKDARRFVVRRGALRYLLGRYLDRSPAAIVLAHGPQGKPALAPDPARRALHFNLSDSGEMAVYALGSGQPLGVDIEARRDISDERQLAARHFSPAEREWLQQQPADEAADAFLRCWTCKEAVVKALGDGLTTPLSAFTAAHWQQPARLLWADGLIRSWTIRLLSPPAGYVAALASSAAIDALEERQLLIDA